MATSSKPRISTKPRIRQNDQVIVRTGKDAGKRGSVVRVLPREGRVIVEQVNIVKRHMRPRPPSNPQQAARQQPTGGVIEKEAPLALSNVALVCPGCDKPTRVGYRIKDDGRKVRVCRNADCAVDIDK